MLASDAPLDLPSILPVAVDATAAAGLALRHWFHQGHGRAGLPEVDAQVEEALRATLLAALSCGWRGRLTAPAYARGRPTWVVEPHDGGDLALEGVRGAAVSVALLVGGRPVLGVVHAYAHPGEAGMTVSWAEGCGPVRRDGRDLRPVPDRSVSAGAMVVVPAAQAPDPEAVGRAVAPCRFAPLPGSALGLALVACGEALAACGSAPVGHGSVAAGHALLAGAGLALRDLSGRDVTLPPKPGGSVAGFVGAPARAAGTLVPRMAGGVPAIASDVPRRPRHAVRPCADGVRLDRARGCLLGQFAGDSLGGLVEFQVPEDIRSRYPDGVRRLADGGTWDTLAGQVTDDGEMALALARSILRTRGYYPRDAFGAYRSWLASRPFDVGTTTRKALSAPFGGAAAVTMGSQANGSLMRVSPLGLACAGHPDLAASHAAADSALTHPDPTCVASCRAFAAAVAVGVAGGTRDGMLAAAADHAGTDAGADRVRDVLAEAAASPPADYVTQMGHVVIALGNAFHLLGNGTSMARGVVDTVMRGGDTDTNAAIAGALLGAADGMRGVPAQWRRMVTTCRPIRSLGAVRPRPPEFWADDALELAEALLAASDGSGPSLAACRGWPHAL